MLDSIEIRNFKAIQGDDKPLILKNLAQVNYLVGENGSGKSSVLEGVLKREATVKLVSGVKISKSEVTEHIYKQRQEKSRSSNLYKIEGGKIIKL